jgi:hypothetical protein
MLFTSGYWTRGEFNAAPIRWHWTLLLGLGFASDFSLKPLSWLFYLGLVQTHLMAHAWSVGAAGHHPIGYDIQGFGGKVRWNGVASVRVQVRHAWAGALAQLVLFVMWRLIVALMGPVPVNSWLEELDFVWGDLNLVMIAVNLLPLPTFDGESAWKVWALARRRKIAQRRFIILEVTRREPPKVDPQQVAREVDRELAELVSAHHARTDSVNATRGSAGSRRPGRPKA